MPQAKLDIERYVNDLADTILGDTVLADTQPIVQGEIGSLESVLKGLAVELWSDAAGRIFIVADDDDARRLGEPRGIVYTASEMRRVIRIGDPAIVLEIHEWKRRFSGRLRE